MIIIDFKNDNFKNNFKENNKDSILIENVKTIGSAWAINDFFDELNIKYHAISNGFSFDSFYFNHKTNIAYWCNYKETNEHYEITYCFSNGVDEYNDKKIEVETVSISKI